MECDTIRKAKKHTNKKNIKSKIQMSQDENSDLKKELKNKDTSECKKKNTGNTLQEGSDSTEESKNEDIHEIKSKDKNIGNETKTLQNADSKLKKELKNSTHKLKLKDEDIGKEMLQNENSDAKEALKNKDTCEVICKKKKIRNEIKASQEEDSDSEKSENEDTNEVKRKNESIQNKKKILQDEDSNLKKELKNDIHRGKGIKMLQNENNNAKEALKNKDTCKVESDEDVMEEYCSDATYLARQMTSAERLGQAESKQLYNLNVQLRHAVPPQHKIETRAGSHMPTRDEIEQFERIIPIKRGSYSLEEDKSIATNWKAFCKLHNWDITMVKPFLQLRIDKLTYMRNTTERRKFVQFLAAGLPNRTLYSVYHRFKNLYEDNVQRRYKPEEDEMIINHLEHNPSLDERRKYTDLAKVLRRTRHSIWRRYRILKKKKKKYEDD